MALLDKALLANFINTGHYSEILHPESAPKTAETQKKSVEKPGTAQTKTPYVLIIDKDVAAYALLSGHFYNYTFRWVGNYKEGRHAIRIYLPVVKLIILDCELPFGDSFQLLTHIQNTHPQLPVLMWSEKEKYQEKAHRYGAAAFFKKPDLTQLGNLIDSLIYPHKVTPSPSNNILTQSDQQ